MEAKPEDRMRDFFAKYRKTNLYLYFAGVRYSNRGNVDSNLKGIKIFGRNSLISGVFKRFSRERLNKIFSSNPDFFKKNPQNFLDVLSKKILMAEKSVDVPQDKSFMGFFDSHYGEDVHGIIKYILLLKHREAKKNLRVGQDPLIIWRGNPANLAEERIQLDFYQLLFDSCSDPIALKLAFARQYWWCYEKDNLDETFKSIKANYNRHVLGSKRYADKSHSIETIRVSDKWCPVIKAIVNYYNTMSIESVNIPIPGEFVENGHFVYQNMFIERVKKSLLKVGQTNIIRGLEYGLLASPFWMMRDFYNNSMTDSLLAHIVYKYRYLSDWEMMKEKFNLVKIWESGEEDL